MKIRLNPVIYVLLVFYAVVATIIFYPTEYQIAESLSDKIVSHFYPQLKDTFTTNLHIKGVNRND